MDVPLGVQSFTYREFDVPGMCRELAETPVEYVELCAAHIEPDADADEIEDVRSRLAEAGVEICGYGVHNFESPGDARGVFEFADELGAAYLSANFPADRDDIADALVDAGSAFDLRIAIHNHGPGAEFSIVEDVLGVVEGRDRRLGACVDTGHYLRSGQSPDDVIPALGERVHAVHLKDFVGGETEVIPGDGEIDLGNTLSLLETHTSFDQPLVVEYEEDPDDPTPAIVTVGERLAGF